MGKIRLAIGLILVFLVGGLLGILGTEIYYKYRMERILTKAPTLNHRIDMVTKRLSTRLDLTEQQQIEIRKIVTMLETELFVTRQKYIPETKGIMDRYFALMKEQLNPEQKEKLDRIHSMLQHQRDKAPLRKDRIKNSLKPPLNPRKDRP